MRQTLGSTNNRKALMQCPKCGIKLATIQHHDVKMRVGSDALSAGHSLVVVPEVWQNQERRMITLYDFPMSPRARKARIVLAEKGLRYEKVTVDITKGEQKKPEFLAINPYGKVPALQDDGTSVYESTIIMEYLNDKYPNPPLLPADPGQRARARVLMHYGDTPYDGALGAIVGQVFFKPKGQADQEVIAKAKQDLNACFERLERELGNGDYLLGSSFTLADICFVTWAPLFGSLQVEIPNHCSRVQAWFKRMQERESVKTVG